MSCLTALALLVSTSGMGVVYHYCAGELDTVSLSTDHACDCDRDDDCGGDSAACGKDCCTTTVHILKTTDAFVLMAQKDLAITTTELAFLPVLSFHAGHYQSGHYQSVSQSSFFLDTSPPHSENIPIRFCSLLI